MFIFKLLRIIVHALTVVALVIAIVFIGVALCTPYWRFAWMDNMNQHRYLGLWEHCSQDEHSGELGDITCSLKESKPNHDVNHVDHEHHDFHRTIKEKTDKKEYFEGWEIATIVLLTLAVCFGIFGVIFGFLSLFVDYCKYKPMFICISITWCILHLIGTVLATAGIVVYLRHSFDTQHRSITHLNSSRELSYGRSFYNCAIGVIMYAISLIFAVASVIMVCIFAHRERHEYTQVRYVAGGGGTEKITTF